MNYTPSRAILPHSIHILPLLWMISYHRILSLSDPISMADYKSWDSTQVVSWLRSIGMAPKVLTTFLFTLADFQLMIETRALCRPIRSQPPKARFFFGAMVSCPKIINMIPHMISSLVGFQTCYSCLHAPNMTLSLVGLQKPNSGINQAQREGNRRTANVCAVS